MDMKFGPMLGDVEMRMYAMEVAKEYSTDDKDILKIAEKFFKFIKMGIIDNE